MKRFGIGAALVLAVIVQMGFSHHVEAANDLTFSEYATHPYASKTGFASGVSGCSETFCVNGQTILDMGITNAGELVGGYGDWNMNVDSYGVAEGGVYVVPLKLSDGSWDMSHAIRVGSEATDTVREIRGQVFVPSIDPSLKVPTGYSSTGSGFATSEGGWRYVKDTVNFEHMFDIASSSPENFYEFGSSQWSLYSEGVANGYYSMDDGVTWTWGVADDSAVTSSFHGYERYYWAAQLNGKVYIQAMGTDPAAPGRVLDEVTNTWSEAWPASTSVCSTYFAKLVVTFDNHIVCPEIYYGYGTATKLNTYDGTSVGKVTFGGTGLQDLYVARDGYLYVLDMNANIYRTNSLSQPFQLVGSASGVSGGAYSIAVWEDKVYIGSKYGKIYRSDVTISSTQPASPASQTVNLTNAETSDPVSIQIAGATSSTCSTVAKESALTAQDADYTYPVGLVDFCFTTPDTDNQVTVTFVTDKKAADVVLRKYNSTTNTYATVTGATLTDTTYNGQAAVRAVYTITDNGSLDLDPATGTIKDPVGIAVANTTTGTGTGTTTGTGTSTGTGTGATTTSGNTGTNSGSGLASTGANMIVIAASSAAALVIGAVLLILHQRRSRTMR